MIKYIEKNVANSIYSLLKKIVIDLEYLIIILQ